MKKILSVLTTFGFVSSSTVSVIACDTKEKPNPKIDQPKKDITKIVQDFEQDVTKIWTEHYEKEIVGNLIGVTASEESNEFINKVNIQKFSKPENKNKLTAENKIQLTNDVQKLFKTKLLEEKLNTLKKVNKYKIILDEVDSVFDSINLLFDNNNFLINSGEINTGLYIGNIVIDYKVVTKYKGLNSIEKFAQYSTLKYTSTDSETFKKVGEEMYKNIAKDVFISKETEEFVNLQWNKIKGNSGDSAAYLSSNTQLKKYYNENNQFHNALLKIMKENYLEKKFGSLKISYEKSSVYKTEDFAEQNKDYLIINNLYKSDDDIVSFDMSMAKDYQKISKLLLSDKEELTQFLYENQFSPYKWNKIRNNYKIIQDSFLTKFLNKNEIFKYQESNNYKLAIAMGFVDFIGPVIKISNGKSSYLHELPDFKLAISYSLNGMVDSNYESLVDFFTNLFNIYKTIYNPTFRSDKKYYFNMSFEKNKIWELLNKNKVELKNSEINNLLKNFNDNYNFSKKMLLDKLKISNKALKEKDIYFWVENYDKNLKNERVMIGSKTIDDYFWVSANWNIETIYPYKTFKNFNYMVFNLFGILKIKINFDSSLEHWNELVIF
ncbi:lipoprotein [Spiroplasma floricola]|uniref:Lipoprotein n=1 Tax=Spiroplasma floricola 23-6 TaxID=1336749 RepID=A0A2K8SCS4_9MOLU|nr:lipoprotein [Spiroplasma floricola]AUB31246.1 hypothetical protein SFLOR_v1c01850 [Spiroplasma floricola 23-6]